MSEPSETTAPGASGPSEILPGFQRHVVDGVEVVHGPLLDGEWAGGIMFRVGRADETLATSGLSHLVEHLALQQRAAGDHANGSTGDQVTHLYTTGTREEVVAFLNQVCEHLRDLPLQRLEIEKQILRTEAASRGRSPIDELPEARYGARRYGLSSLPEYGLLRVDAAAVGDWVDQHFTSGNAVAWICGDELPAGLDLRLKPGPRRPGDSRQEWWGLDTKKLPAHLPVPGTTIAASAVLERTVAVEVFTTLLANALHDEMRQRDGVSYTATAHFVPRDAKWGELYAVADALPEMRDAAIGSFVDVFARMRWGTITEQEFEAARNAELRSLEQGLVGGRLAPGLAHSLVLGREVTDAEQRRERLERLDVEVMGRVARNMWPTLLVQAGGQPLEWADYLPAHARTGRLEGTEYRPLWGDEPPLVIGEIGIGARLDAGDVSTRWTSVVGLLCHPDGGRVVISSAGRHIVVEPEMYGLSPEVMADIDRRIDPALHIPMPPRDPARRPRRPDGVVPAAAPAPQQPQPDNPGAQPDAGTPDSPPPQKKRRWGLRR